MGPLKITTKKRRGKTRGKKETVQQRSQLLKYPAEQLVPRTRLDDRVFSVYTGNVPIQPNLTQGRAPTNSEGLR